MARPKPGMGRGLGAILPASAQAPPGDAGELRELPVELISPGSRQPRRRFDEESLAALAASLGEQGVLQPVLVRPLQGGRYELVAGERRWRAAQIAGLATLPAIVRSRADAQALEAALVENMAREDLNAIEEARACAALVEELGLTREQVGRRVGRSRVAVSNLVRLLELPDEVIALIESDVLSEGHGRALLLAEDHAERARLARAAAREQWSVRATEEQARRSNGAPMSSSVRSPADPHPDQQEAAREIGDALGAALGREVSVKPTRQGRYSVQLSFASPEEALELARRIGPRQ